ncbi:hypothetical protein ColLi_10726 [Colletotrichum liriopes]|uniref:Knr4/Smi1-like domain-containing protein n=1 Tax=Colletotrichum liriopes TaxID=708192 RepID=A0AA37GV75_9PEZI|nr:hypothetical protein ColLi_10726 [Colletotrichum liriopes]
MDFFIRHLTEPTAIAEEPSLSQIVLRVRETAVCFAVLGQVDYGTRLLSILHSHGIPPFDVLEKGPEIYTEAYAQCQTLAKGETEHVVPVHPPRSDPFTRIVFAFAWEHTREWPVWATPTPEPLRSEPMAPGAAAGNETTLDALERYARTLVCNRFACPWREDMETFELVKGLALRQDNRANPHGPIPVRMYDFWILWERMLAPWPMNQIVKATGRVLALDLAVRLFNPARNLDGADVGNGEEDEENQSKEELIDEFVVDNVMKEKEEEEGSNNEDENTSEGNFKGDEYSIEPWGRYIAQQHDAQDQMPMLGSMRALWDYEWFTDAEKNDLIKVLEINVAQLRNAGEKGCEMLIKRLESGPNRPYAGCTISGLVHAIDKNTRANAKYAPDDSPDRESLLIEHTALGPIDLDEEKVFRPKTLLRHPPPSYQDITDLEKRLEVSTPLPEDYKVFLRTTDGMGPIWWNEFNLLRLLAPISKVAVEEDSYLMRLELELLPNWGLYGPNSINWPPLRRAILISEGGYEGQLYLIEPKYVAEAKAAFFEVYDSATDSDRRLLRREVEEVYGSLEAFRELKWGVGLYTMWSSEAIPYRNFEAVLEAFAGSSRRMPKEWSLSFDPSTRKLLGIYYRPAAEWDDTKEGRLVQMGKGNLRGSENGTISMGKLLYSDLGFNMPIVDH